MYVLIAFYHKNANAVFIGCDNQPLLHHFQWCDFKIPQGLEYKNRIILHYWTNVLLHVI